MVSEGQLGNLLPRLTLVTVLMFTLGLWILFAPGVGFEGSFEVMNDSSQIASVLMPLRPGHLVTLLSDLGEMNEQLGLSKLVAGFPQGLIYAIFGESDFVTRASGLIFSLASLFLVYLIAKEWIGTGGAILAVLFCALIPVEVFYSGTPTRFGFWLPLAVAAVYLSMGFRQRKTVLVAVVAGIAFSLLLIAEFWLGVFLFLFWASTVIDNTRPGTGILLAGSAALLSFIVWIFVYWQSLAGWQTALLEPGMYILLPLFGISLVSGSRNFRRENSEVYVWLLCAAAAGMGSLAGGAVLGEGQTTPLVLILVVGFCILSGSYFIKLQEGVFPNFSLIILMMIILMFAYFGIQAQREFIPSLGGLSWLDFHSILLFSNIASGVFILLIVIIPLFYTGTKLNSRFGLVLPLFALYALSMLSPIWDKVFPYMMLTETMFSAANELNQSDASRPVYLPNPQDRQLLSYYARELNAISGRTNAFPEIRSWESPEAVGDGYVLAREGTLREVPENWVQIDRFGWLPSPTHLVLYRSLTPESAAAELQAADALIQQEPVAGNYLHVYEALINAGEFCRAYQAWMMAMVFGDGASSSIPIRLDLNCFERAFGQDGTDEIAPPNLRVYSGAIILQQAGERESGHPVWRVWRKYDFYYDPRIFNFKTSIAANAFYIYSADVQGTRLEPFYTLYWRIGDKESYFDKRIYADWEKVSSLIYSGTQGIGEVELQISPVLSDNFGDMFFSDVGLVKVLIP
jgi:hypothetical protein